MHSYPIKHQLTLQSHDLRDAFAQSVGLHIESHACSGDKRVTFAGPSSAKREVKSTAKDSPRSGGIVSAVVDSLRRLSSWGYKRSTDLDVDSMPTVAEDQAEILADIGLPAGALEGPPQQALGREKGSKAGKMSTAKGNPFVGPSNLSTSTQCLGWRSTHLLSPISATLTTYGAVLKLSPVILRVFGPMQFEKRNIW